MDDLQIALPGIIAILIVILIRILAKQKNPLGRFCRGFWNISFKLCSMIPFFGWMAHFIIADTAQEKASKKGYQEDGQKRDSAAYDYADKKVKIKLEEQKREQMEFEERRRMEDAITSQLKNKKLPVHIHGNSVDIGEQTYSLDEIKNEFHLK